MPKPFSTTFAFALMLGGTACGAEMGSGNGGPSGMGSGGATAQSDGSSESLGWPGDSSTGSGGARMAGEDRGEDGSRAPGQGSSKDGGAPGTSDGTGGRRSADGRGAGGASAGGRVGRDGGSARDGARAGAGGLSATGGSQGSQGKGGMASPGGSGGSAGDGTACPLPTKFKWTSSGPLAKVPRTIGGHNVIALKDFTDVLWNGKHIVYSTAYEGGWKSSMFVFADWADWDATAGTWFTKNAVAPTLIYFTPKKIWVLTYQWGFQYATSDDPTDASKWSGGKTLLSGDPTGGSGPIDQTVICDSANCYLFFAGDNGHIYRASMPIDNFPGTFSNATSIMQDSQSNLFEAVEVYTVKGGDQYLMIVEAMGSGGRYFRGFTSSSLGGTFTAISGASTESSPFAGKNNVTFSEGAWTNDISHGDMVRNDPSETQTVDPCNMQFLYQGYDKTKSTGDYGTTPYQPGLLTLTR